MNSFSGRKLSDPDGWNLETQAVSRIRLGKLGQQTRGGGASAKGR